MDGGREGVREIGRRNGMKAVKCMCYCIPFFSI